MMQTTIPLVIGNWGKATWSHEGRAAGIIASKRRTQKIGLGLRYVASVACSAVGIALKVILVD